MSKANYTVTFADGTEHTYTGAPAGLSQDEVYDRASRDFQGKKVQHMHREVEQLPVQARPGAENQSNAETRRLSAQAAEARRPKTLGDKAIKAGVDLYRGITDSGTAGFADEIRAGRDSYLKGTTYEAELEAQRQQDAEGGIPRIVGQVVGSLLPGGLILKGGQAITKAANTGRAVATGGLYGSAYGAGSSTETDASGIAADAALGGLAGAAGAKAIDAAGRGIKWIANRPSLAKLAEPAQVKQQASEMFDKADELGVSIRPKALQPGIDGIVSNLTKAGITPQSPVRAHQEVFQVVDYLRQATTSKQPLTWRDAENLRRAAVDVARSSPDPTVRKFVGEIVDDFDDVIGGLQPAAFTNAAGPARTAEALKLTRDARAQWKQVSKSELLEEIGRKVEAGQLTSSRSDTKAIRTAITSLMRNKKQWSRFNAQEKQALAEIAKTTVTGKSVDLAEAAKFGSGRLSDLSNAGLALATDGGSLAVNAGASMLTGLRDKLTQKELDDLIKLIANNRVPNQFTGSTSGAVTTGMGTGMFGGALGSE